MSVLQHHNARDDQVTSSILFLLNCHGGSLRRYRSLKGSILKAEPSRNCGYSHPFENYLRRFFQYNQYISWKLHSKFDAWHGLVPSDWIVLCADLVPCGWFYKCLVTAARSYHGYRSAFARPRFWSHFWNVRPFSVRKALRSGKYAAAMGFNPYKELSAGACQLQNSHASSQNKVSQFLKQIGLRNTSHQAHAIIVSLQLRRNMFYFPLHRIFSCAHGKSSDLECYER